MALNGLLEPAPTTVVVDCDPGVDDAAALALALVSPELNVAGITTVAGNVELARTTANALALLGTIGREDVPVSAGARRALAGPKPRHPLSHGTNGLGGLELPLPRQTARPEGAIQWLAALLRRAQPRSVTIVAIGPLTNMALFSMHHPELINRIRSLVVMGTSSGPGNITPQAEYNTWADPEAAQRVLTQPDIEIVVAELQVTGRATLDPKSRSALRTGSELGARLDAMIDGYDDGPPGYGALHDVVAMAAVIDPTLIDTRPAALEVVTGASWERGHSIIEWNSHPVAKPRMRVTVDLDVERWREMFVTRISATR